SLWQPSARAVPPTRVRAGSNVSRQKSACKSFSRAGGGIADAVQHTDVGGLPRGRGPGPPATVFRFPMRFPAGGGSFGEIVGAVGTASFSHTRIAARFFLSASPTRTVYHNRRDKNVPVRG